MDDSIVSFGTKIGSPQKVYRFFKEEWQAESLLKGEIWLSTLDACRKYENSEQGDKREATRVHFNNHVAGSPLDPKVRETARRLNIEFGDNNADGFIVMSQNVCTEIFENSFLLCTTTVNTPEIINVFGEYGVEITNTHEFNSILSFALFDNLGIKQGLAGSVKYATQALWDHEATPPEEKIMLTKEPRYSYQNEFRFLWKANKQPIEPFLFQCPDIKHLCRKV